MKHKAVPDVQQPWRQFVVGYLQLLLANARDAHRRLDSREPETVHQFRVAVRRLHTWLSLPGLLPLPDQKLLKGLKRYIKVTNAFRDADVQNQWMKQHGYSECPHRKTAPFPAGWHRLAHRLDLVITAAGKAGDGGLNESFACRAACVLQVLSDAFAASLREIVDVTDDRHMHRSRIWGKRLRYLLEPFTASDERAACVVQQLVLFQDCTGMLHDLAMMREQSLPEDVARMAIEQEMQEQYRDFSHDYLQGSSGLLQELALLIEQLKGV